MLALSRSLPVVFSPMSPRTTPGVGFPCASRRSTRKACGPRLVPRVIRSATTTALVAVNPWLIQFLHAPSWGVRRRNRASSGSHVAVVCTTRPELTPASRSVRAKHPSVPSACMRSNAARCAGPPSSSTVPAKRLYSTVKRMLNPGPCSNPWLTNSLCASKNLSGFSRRSENFNNPARTSPESRSAESRTSAAGVASTCPSVAEYVARHLARSTSATPRSELDSG
mmetsp:Transcript_36997/g.92096  ORF Transcript_36997/g.92096 Transcript_36997/m.92096 type:complete len:225 (-) Transcript_36997:145-819(-)